MVFTSFTTLNSINAVMQAVVGGIGHISGAIIGGSLQVGSVGQLVIQDVLRIGSASFILAMVGAVGTLVILVRNPDGIAGSRPWPVSLFLQ